MSTPFKLPLGRVVATPGALDTFTHLVIASCLSRHESGDWGDVCAEEGKENDRAAFDDGRILSAYDIRGDRLWIITEADRSSTTLLLPDEY